MPEVLGGRSPRPDAAAYTRVLMADKPKKQKTKAKKDEPGVLGSLSSARPERIGSRRGSTGRARAAAADRAAGPATAKTRAPHDGRQPRRAKAAAQPTATAETAARRDGRREAEAEAREAQPKPRDVEPKPAAEAAARERRRRRRRSRREGDAPRSEAAPRSRRPPRSPRPPRRRSRRPPPRARSSRPRRRGGRRARAPPTSRPRPVRDAAPGIGGRREDFEETGTSRPSGTELAATAAKAAGEVAQLGLAIGGKLLKRASRADPQALAALR